MDLLIELRKPVHVNYALVNKKCSDSLCFALGSAGPHDNASAADAFNLIRTVALTISRQNGCIDKR